MRQQMVLGDFIFGLSQGFAYSSLTRNSDGGWADLAIIASKPQSRQNGQKSEKLTFSGTAMYAEGMQRLDELRALQNLRYRCLWSTASAVTGAFGGSMRWRKPRAA